ncbi:hypothetical protein HQ560_15955 [bacterium]|nr:hypothetical protein [bacterium]
MKTLAALLLLAATCSAGESIVAFPESHQTFTFMKDGTPYFELAFGGWGPKWSWLGFRGNLADADGKTTATCTTKVNTGADLKIIAQASKTGTQQFRLAIDLSTTADTPLTCIMTGLTVSPRRFAKGKALVSLADGTDKTVDFPLGRKGLGKAVKQFVLVDDAGETTTIALDPPLDIASDGDARILLAAGHLPKAEPVHAVMTITLPHPLTYHASPAQVPGDADADQWYTFKPTTDHTKPSEIGMQAWLETPAGKHGRILRKADKLIYNGKPIKLWGLNVCYGSCAPEKELADRRATFYAKFGINAVRLHKYADGPGWAGVQSADSFVEFDKAGLDRMDYFVAQLKKHGIYTKLSSTFGVKIGPKDRKFVPYMDEFGRGKNRIATGHGSVFLSTELQDMQIKQIVNILKHKNPYTGLTYAEDPAISVVELFNEDSALFYGTLGRLQKIPTLRKRASEQFSDWLEKRYGSEVALLKAWGKNAFGSFRAEGFGEENWEERTVVPAGNPWFFDPVQLAGSQAPKRQRLLDTMLFLYEIQNAFYDRYVAAIRAAGYKGEILASNWQAGRAFSHYYNLHSDYRVGLIDRHNYFGGGGGAKINNVTMLRVPGSGLLSTGMQQVGDRPFMLSEWIHVTPSEWGVEGPAILGAYGMGLQGWDVSYMFQNRDTGGFADRVDVDQWSVTKPCIVGVFPAVARHVLRGDVAESDVRAVRNVHVPSMAQGKLSFEDRATQQHDVKTFDSDKVPARTLAVARCVVDFTDTYRDTPAFDLAQYVKGGVTTSTTGQLRWTEGKSRLDGAFTMDTPATKAVVGFAEGQTHTLGDVTITPQSRFAAIYVTARDPNEDIASAKNLLIVAIARARNTGAKIVLDSRILAKGTAPVVMEPVRAAIRIPRAAQATVHILDHDGHKTGKTLPIANGILSLDTAKDKTPYYVITYGQ